MRLYQFLNDIKQQKIEKNIPNLSVGDKVSVDILIQEGNKQRTQTYQGTLIAIHLDGGNSTLTIRRTFQGVGVERNIRIYSPTVRNINVIRNAKVRRSKLYYLRHLKGKAARTSLLCTILHFNTNTLFYVNNYVERIEAPKYYLWKTSIYLLLP